MNKIEVGYQEDMKIQLGFYGLFNDQSDEYAFLSLQEAYQYIKTDKDKEAFRKSLESYIVAWYNNFDHPWKPFVNVIPDTQNSSIVTNELKFSIPNICMERELHFSIVQLLEVAAKSVDEAITTYIFSALIGGYQSLDMNTSRFLLNHEYSCVSSDNINSDIICNRPIYDASNSIKNSQLTVKNIEIAYKMMIAQERLQMQNPIQLYGCKYLIAPIELEETIIENQYSHYLRKSLIKPIIVDSFYLGKNKENWYLVNNLNILPSINIMFKDNIEVPTLTIIDDYDKDTDIFMSFSVNHSYICTTDSKGLVAALN